MASEARPSQYATKRLPRTLWVLVMTLECAHCWFYRQFRDHLKCLFLGGILVSYINLYITGIERTLNSEG